MTDLTDKIVLVTGAARGIGAATARAVLAAGGSVVLHYNTRRDGVEEIAETAPERCHIVAADLADPAAPAALIEAALGWQGRFDVLVNNAAIYEPDGDEVAAWRAAWHRTLQVNLIAPAELSEAAIRHFLARGAGGTLIHISSRGAHRGETLGHASYAASKGGLNSFSHTIARAHAKDGILSYAIAPGWVGTDMAWDYIEQTGDRSMMKDIPMQDFVPPEEVANIVVFLASGAARHATGTIVDINGASFPR